MLSIGELDAAQVTASEKQNAIAEIDLLVTPAPDRRPEHRTSSLVESCAAYVTGGQKLNRK